MTLILPDVSDEANVCIRCLRKQNNLLAAQLHVLSLILSLLEQYQTYATVVLPWVHLGLHHSSKFNDLLHFIGNVLVLDIDVCVRFSYSDNTIFLKTILWPHTV